MTTARCDQKGCDFHTTQSTVAVANRVIGYHKRRMHGIVGKSVSSQWKAKKAAGLVVTRNSESPQPEAAEAQPTVVPNFCPNCGCNLRVITAALNLRAKR